jgi:nicotinamidase-related amidase
MAPRIPEIRDWLDRRKSALLVIGLQAGIASPTGAMAKAGNDVSAIQVAIEKERELMTMARGAHVPPITVRCMTRPETDNPAWLKRRARLGLGPDTSNRELEGGGDFYPSRPALPGEIAVYTTGYSAFDGSTLDERMKGLEIDTLVVCGQTTDLYVDATVRDGFQRGYQMFVVPEACAAYDQTRHKAAIEALARDYAILLDMSDVEDAWTG